MTKCSPSLTEKIYWLKIPRALIIKFRTLQHNVALVFDDENSIGHIRFILRMVILKADAEILNSLPSKITL